MNFMPEVVGLSHPARPQAAGGRGVGVRPGLGQAAGLWPEVFLRRVHTDFHVAQSFHPAGRWRPLDIDLLTECGGQMFIHCSVSRLPSLVHLDDFKWVPWPWVQPLSPSLLLGGARPPPCPGVRESLFTTASH